MRRSASAEKPVPDKRLEKPVTDKSATFDKNTDKFQEGKFSDKLQEGKFSDKLGEDGGGFGLAQSALEGRIAQLESVVGAMMSSGSGFAAGSQPFIGSDLRPDLSGGAFMAEDDMVQQGMRAGSADAKRLYDTKRSDV